MTAVAEQAPPARRQRLESVDLLRGIAMIVMALDHTRDFFGDYSRNPTDPATTTAALFFTRWITHFCAPTFFLLTGVGARLSLGRKTPAEVSRYLFTRGVWLIVLEAMVLRLAMQFNVDYRVTVLTVLWALGWSMIGLALLVRLPDRMILGVGLGLILLHNAADGIPAAALGAFAPLWTLLHAPGFLYQGSEHVVLIAYPIVPWVGVTAVGYALGRIFEWEPERRRQLLWRAGLVATVAFVALRFVNVYGDPSRWSAQERAGFTFLSFLNTTKYPPSLLFLLMTLGPVLCLLALLDRGTPRWGKPVVTIGRVPLFYFMVHFFWIHILAFAVCLGRYGSAHWLFESPGLDKFPFTQPPGWPLGLGWVYLVWGVVVLTVYPPCVWYAGVKARRRDWWLSYL